MPTGNTTRKASITLRGPYDLAEVALMGFGHPNESSFDGVMRLAFCLDGHEQQVGVEVRQTGEDLGLVIHGDGDLDAISRQVARVVSADGDGIAWDAVCAADPVLARVHAVAPGFRPANFYSPYEAAIPTPTRFLSLESFPGLPADRLPRLHAIASAALEGQLDVDHLCAMEPDAAMIDLQRLPGIGPFYSALIVIRALGLTDVLSTQEDHTREAVREQYGLDHSPTDAELAHVADAWRPFRTWATVTFRALSARV